MITCITRDGWCGPRGPAGRSGDQRRADRGAGREL